MTINNIIFVFNNKLSLISDTKWNIWYKRSGTFDINGQYLLIKSLILLEMCHIISQSQSLDYIWYCFQNKYWRKAIRKWWDKNGLSICITRKKIQHKYFFFKFLIPDRLWHLLSFENLLWFSDLTVFLEVTYLWL